MLAILCIELLHVFSLKSIFVVVEVTYFVVWLLLELLSL